MDRLTEMEAFATVVDQGGFTDAAKKMGISKSAVLMQVKRMRWSPRCNRHLLACCGFRSRPILA